MTADSTATAEAWVYLLRCGDGSLYCGWTVDIERRLRQHQAGRASRYTRTRLPVTLAFVARMDSASGGAAGGGADQAAEPAGKARVDLRRQRVQPVAS